MLGALRFVEGNVRGVFSFELLKRTAPWWSFRRRDVTLNQKTCNYTTVPLATTNECSKKRKKNEVAFFLSKRVRQQPIHYQLMHFSEGIFNLRLCLSASVPLSCSVLCWKCYYLAMFFHTVFAKVCVKYIFFIFFGLGGHCSLPPFSCLASLLAFFFFFQF